MSECCGVVKKNKNGFFDSNGWKIGVIAGGVVLVALSYFWGQIAHAANAHWLKYLDPAWIVVFVCGWPMAYGGFVNLVKNKKVKTSLLVTVAMIACIVLEILTWVGVADTASSHGHGNLFAAGEVALLMWIGEFLEDITLKRSRKGIESLVKLTAAKARIKMGDQYVEMDSQYVAVDDVVLIKPNELIPVDGVVTEGNTSVSQAAITGESVPVDKTAGDEVFAGTLNQNGAIVVRVTKPQEDSAISKMIKLVREAESKKAPIERTADKWSKVIVPSAIILSVLVFLLVLLAFKESWAVALTRAVTILVVFCPCSLALATPTAIAAGIGNASFKGALVKSGSALESLAKTKVAVFDKTGTLTLNKLSVIDFETDIDKQTFFKALGGVEQNSEHPLAKAITEFCAKKTEIPAATDTESLVGLGVKAVVDGKKVCAAKVGYFKDLSDSLAQKSQKMLKDGLTVVGVEIDGKCVGVMGLSDVVKPDAKRLVSDLDELGIQSVMLTGDNALSAQNVAKEVGIKQVRHDLMPQEKVDTVRRFVDEGANVCMVGDGVNDAPALATATVGIAMGAMGSDAALEVADVVLMNDDLFKVSGLIRLSRRVLTTITINIIAGMAINLGSVALSALGILTPALGALVHNASSVFVVSNSALILGAKRPFKKSEKTDKKSNI